MSQLEIAKSIELLEKDWDIDPIIKDFHLGKRDDVTENSIRINDVVFHIPFLNKIKKFILWKCYWPDCSNCCSRQGRLPLTSHDLITIGAGMKYQKTSDFIKNETVMATWEEGCKMTKAWQESMRLFSLLVTAQAFTLMIQWIP